MKILGAILTSEHLPQLQRGIDSLTGVDEVIIFVDTWRKSHQETVIETYSDQYQVICSDFELKGSPGQGKNFVLDYFLQSDFTHMIPIDGDDFLWPDAVRKMKNIIQNHPADFYHYAWHDMITPKGLGTTKNWVDKFLKTVKDANDPRWVLLPNIHDVDRIAIETKKSANIKYKVMATTLEDCRRNLTLKMLSNKGIMRGLSIRSNDLYVYHKDEEIQYAKRRPRVGKRKLAGKFINQTDFPWQEKRWQSESLNACVFEELEEADRKLMSVDLKHIDLQDELTAEDKQRFLSY